MGVVERNRSHNAIVRRCGICADSNESDGKCNATDVDPKESNADGNGNDVHRSFPVTSDVGHTSYQLASLQEKVRSTLQQFAR